MINQKIFDEKGQIDLKNPLAVRILKDTFKDNPIAFGKFFFPHLFKAKTPDFHKEIAELYRTGIDKLAQPEFKDVIRNALIVPRGHAKTSIAVTLFFLWSIVHLKFHYGIIITNTSTLAEDNLSTIAKELVNNTLLKLVYFPNTRIDSGLWNREEIECFIPDDRNVTQSLKIKAFGSGKEVRGTKYGAYRPDVIVCDDLETSEQVNSKEQRAKLKKWVEGDVMPLFGDRGYFCIIGTILHYDSILNNIKDNVNEAYSDYNTIQYKAIEKDEFGVEHALWEDWKPLSWLHKEMERLSLQGELSSFYREYLNTPVSEEERDFKDEVIEKNIYESIRLWEKVKRGDLRLHVSMGIDTAISVKDKADFSAIVLLGTDENGVRYVLEAWHDKVSSDVLTDKVFEFYKRYKPNVVAMQQASIDQLYKANFEERMRKTGVFFTISKALYNTSNGNNKEARIRGLVAPFNTNSIKLLRSQTALINELITFPHSRHDDLLDALQIAFVYSVMKKRDKLDVKAMNSIFQDNFYKHF